MLYELYGVISWFHILKQDWSTHNKSCFAVKLHKRFVDYRNLNRFLIDMLVSR